jgi:hypothetical protein
VDALGTTRGDGARGDGGCLGSLPTTLDEALDTLTVAKVILAVRTARDRNDWDAMRATYHPDSFVHLLHSSVRASFCRRVAYAL